MRRIRFHQQLINTMPASVDSAELPLARPLEMGRRTKPQATGLLRKAPFVGPFRTASDASDENSRRKLQNVVGNSTAHCLGLCRFRLTAK